MSTLTLLEKHNLHELPAEERRDLIEALEQSLEPSLEESDPEYAAELERRWQEFEADPSIGMTWEEVEKSLQEAIDRCRAKR